MKQYKVEIEEVLQCRITIDAENRRENKRKIKTRKENRT